MSDDLHPGWANGDGKLYKTLEEAEAAYNARVAGDLPPLQFVYFIQAGPRGAIKIGLAKDPWDRLHNLQTGSPHQLEIIAVMVGDRLFEQQLHHELAEFHLGGEWFRPTAPVRAKIAVAKRDHKKWQCRWVVKAARERANKSGSRRHKGRHSPSVPRHCDIR